MALKLMGTGLGNITDWQMVGADGVLEAQMVMGSVGMAQCQDTDGTAEDGFREDRGTQKAVCRQMEFVNIKNKTQKREKMLLGILNQVKLALG